MACIRYHGESRLSNATGARSDSGPQQEIVRDRVLDEENRVHDSEACMALRRFPSLVFLSALIQETRSCQRKNETNQESAGSDTMTPL